MGQNKGLKQRIDIEEKMSYFIINKPATPLLCKRILAGIFLSLMEAL